MMGEVREVMMGEVREVMMGEVEVEQAFPSLILPSLIFPVSTSIFPHSHHPPYLPSHTLATS